MKRISLLLTALSCTANLVAQTALFEDASITAGIADHGVNSGIAFTDYDADGDQDFYLSRLSGGDNLLYRNNGNGTFTEVTAAAGVNYEGSTLTAVWGDINNDGYPDLYLGNSLERNLLYRNNGDGTFTDISVQAAVRDQYQPRAVLMADVNADGLLDIYVANLAAENRLYRNDGDETFTDITASSGATDKQIAMGSLFFDYDNDGDQDLYLTHDSRQANILYQNDGTGRFTNVAAAAGVDYKGFGMGVDAGDYNNDGWLDLYITNLFENVLYRNNGDGTFTEVGAAAGVDDYGMGWGTAWLDYDNDGWLDLYMANDSDFSDYSNILYRNNGDGTFTSVSTDSPVHSNNGAYGTACADVNNDGWPDLFVANKSSRHNELFINTESNGNHWLQLTTIGTLSNQDGIGARVWLYQSGQLIGMDEVHAGTGYASQNAKDLHFGLGALEQVDELHIRWPNGLEERYIDLQADYHYTLTEAEGIAGGPDQPTGPTEPEVVTSLIRQAAVTDAIRVYPNPARATVTISWEQTKGTRASLQLSTIQGKLISQQVLEGLSPWSTQDYTLREVLAPLASGTYLLQIRQGEQVNTTKLQLQGR